MRFFFLSFLLTSLFINSANATQSHSTQPYSGILDQWEVAEGYRLEIDSSGWEFPVAIQFVPNPGNEPNDPLYYVSELRGRIRVVTNDRSIHVFADEIEELRPKEELPHLKGEFGLTGLCLNEATGHVYATTVYRKGGLLFNKILRFKSADSQKFGLKGEKDLEIIEPFAKDRASLSHQIGNCLIASDQKLYVGVGDAHQHHKAQLLHHTSGKMLRFNLDGTAPTDNPFYDASNPTAEQNYVYGYGLRNPFALAETPDRMYVAESGPSVDKLVELEAGRNYLWDGTDASMMINALVVWSDPLGPAGMVYVHDHPALPKLSRRLLITGSVKAFLTSVWLHEGLGVKAPPEVILRYIGNQEEQKQYLVPVALGPDGIYVSGFLPQNNGETHIMKMVPSNGVAASSGQRQLSGEGWYARMGCAGCHSIGGKGGNVGPTLDNLVPRLQEHLFSKKYEAQLDEVDKMNSSPFADYQEVRDQLRKLEGMERVRFWIEKRLEEPSFDMPDSQMPNLQLNEQQVAAITDYLIQISPKDKYQAQSPLKKWAADVKFYLSTHLNVYLGLMFGIGALLGALVVGIFKKRS